MVFVKGRKVVEDQVVQIPKASWWGGYDSERSGSSYTSAFLLSGSFVKRDKIVDVGAAVDTVVDAAVSKVAVVVEMVLTLTTGLTSTYLLC